MTSSRMLSRSLSAALILSGFAACQKAPEKGSTASAPAPADAKTVSAEPSSFDAVARHLDKGGGLYAYFSAEGVLSACSEVLRNAETALFSQHLLPDEQKAQYQAVWKTMKPILANSGIGEISGFGISSLALRPGYYRTKTILHHYAGKGNGFFWKLTGDQARALELVNWLPEGTAAAASFDITLEPLWAELNKQAAGSELLRAWLDQATQQLLASSGLELPKLLAGLGPNYSYVIALDESKPFTIPAPGSQVAIPEPRAALMIQIRDEALIQRLESELAKLPNLSAADQGDLKVRKIGVPIPLPFLTPVIAWKQGLVILSSNEALVHEMLEVKGGKKPGLAATAAFKQAMEGLPSPAASFAYVAPIFGKTMAEIQTMSLNQPGNPADPAIKKMIQSLMGMQSTEPAATVGQTIEEGCLTVGNGGVGPRQMASMVMAVPLGAFAGAATAAKPNFARAKDRSEATRTLESLRLLEASIEQWALENDKQAGDQPTTDEIKVYLKPGTALFKACESNPGGTVVELIPGLPGVTLPPRDGKMLVPEAVIEKFSGTVPKGFWGPYGVR